MPVGRTRSVALLGLSGSLVEVEADLSSQLPAFVVIGLPDAAIGESRDRVRSAAANSGCPLPARRFTVNLSPATLPKHGSGFDLAIALSCLAAIRRLDPVSLAQVVHLGELGLDGRLRPTEGVLPAVLAARQAGAQTVMVPTANVAEATLVEGMRVVGVASLAEAVAWHGGEIVVPEVDPVPLPAGAAAIEPPSGDLADVVGNPAAVEAIIAAAAGGHHLGLFGPPGAGKTMLAARLPGLLPDLDLDAALEVASLRSLSGHRVGALSRRPPYEAPHHTATAASIIGGGSRIIRPGAAPRASHGVLFLDEAPEFPSAVLDVLRQPLESGSIAIHRANAVASFPAQFQLVMAANPCPCGNWTAKGDACTCTPNIKRRYLSRISGPLRDRIDIELWVPRLTTAAVNVDDGTTRVSTAEARTRVEQARAIAAERYRGTPWRTNAQVSGPWLRGTAGMHPGRRATVALDHALEQGFVTMRGYDKTLKVAWTLADIDGADRPTHVHVGRALLLRKAPNL